MKLIAFIIEGTLNTGLKQRLREHDAGLFALRSLGYEFTEEAYNELYNEMKLARSDSPAESALWQAVVSAAIVRGWDRTQQLDAFDDLIAQYKGRAGYTFIEMPGIRDVIEELKFGNVDNWGDAPQIAAITTGGTMARDALEQAKLTTLFDHLIEVDDPHQRLSDPRVFAELLQQADVPGAQAICIGNSLSRGLAAAKLAGMDIAIFHGDDDESYPARGPWEEPVIEASDPDELGDFLMHWLQAPPAKPRKSRSARRVSPSTQGATSEFAGGFDGDIDSDTAMGLDPADDNSPSEDPTGPRSSFE